MIGLIDFFGSLWGRVAVGGGIVATLLAAWVGFAWHYENKGAAKEVAKMERATTDAVNKANRAGSKSVNGTGGVFNPYYRD